MVRIDFDHRLRDQLRTYGLDIRRDQMERECCPDVIFETPCVSMADLRFFQPFFLGAFSYLSESWINNATIGRYCSIGAEVQIGNTNHPVDWLSTSPFQYIPNYHGWPDRVGGHEHVERFKALDFDLYRHTHIGHDVWLGNHVFVKDGVTIGNGAIAAAFAVVTKNVPPYAIVAGNPARIIGYRFETAIIERLMELQWWKYYFVDFAGVDFSNINKAVDEIQRHVDAGLEEYVPTSIDTAAMLQLHKMVKRHSENDSMADGR